MKKVLLTIMMMALLVVMVACGTKDEKKPVTSGTTDKEPAVEAEAEKVTIKHELDTNAVEINKNPETVVVFDFGVLDTLDELGVEVAGLPQSNIPGYLSKYEDSKYKNLGSLKEPDFEALHALKPDVIFISARQADMYDQFAEIAPTVFVGLDYSNYMESFKHNMELVGEIFGKEDDMKSELAEIDAQIAAIKEKASAVEEKSLIVLGTEGKVSAYGPSSRFGIIHDVFGFAPADEKIEASTHGQNITFEYILSTNPGILFVIDRDAAIGNESSVKDSLENDLVIKTDAFKNDKMVYLNGEYWYLSGGGLLSMKEMIKEVEAAL
ncbi:siderophore ABC transporter substrate-binding protein [Sporosarcina siberiensis]|uniref:Siderophore ABC transporter substrate-binding protein n=1 Tax=Sporosarcina siberiensis TaxID=1365606 RepID=A0ABW4SF96_9BACL